MSDINLFVEKLAQLDDRLKSMKEEKKIIDDEIKKLEEGLVLYCQENNQTIESVTGGKYNLKPSPGRRFRKNI
jgi:cell division protein FtsB